MDRFEVDLRDGSFVLRQTDLRLDDVFDAPLTRAYRSGFWPGANPSHAFGVKSSHPFDLAPLGSRNPYTYQVLVLEDGQTLYFPRISKGSGYEDALYRHSETSTRFYKAGTWWNGHGWTTRLADGSEILFPESYAANKLAQGAATEMRDRSRNKLELHRDGERNLREILTPHGRWIHLDYDAQARIVKAEDDQGQQTVYVYNADGMLVSALQATGAGRRYSYGGSLMTAAVDENGRVLVRNQFDAGAVVRQEYAGGAVYAYSYRWDARRACAVEVIVTLPNHRQQIVHPTCFHLADLGRP